MGQLIANFIGFAWNTTTTQQITTIHQFCYMTGCLCACILVFYVCDTVHDIVNLIGERVHKK